mmetsp:Transcript_33972/g.67281  ORF Transcript_33972/g.67281 Transcript_33972/m.67281 type:complete len:241 (+) Transcript_33972:232-954(+)
MPSAIKMEASPAPHAPAISCSRESPTCTTLSGGSSNIRTLASKCVLPGFPNLSTFPPNFSYAAAITPGMKALEPLGSRTWKSGLAHTKGIPRSTPFLRNGMWSLRSPVRLKQGADVRGRSLPSEMISTPCNTSTSASSIGPILTSAASIKGSLSLPSHRIHVAILPLKLSLRYVLASSPDVTAPTKTSTSNPSFFSPLMQSNAFRELLDRITIFLPAFWRRSRQSRAPGRGYAPLCNTPY